jgi:hypothetical protein
MFTLRHLKALALIIMFCTSGEAATLPRYEHIFVIIGENKSYKQIIGNVADAPQMNSLASQYGLATEYYGVVHPSEGNYVAMLGGNTFGIHDDDAWFCQPKQQHLDCEESFNPNYQPHTINARSLMDQLEESNLTWKGYFEDLPAPGSTIIEHPSDDPDRPKYLYVASHNGFLNFTRVRQDPQMAEKIVPMGQLAVDLVAGRLPNYAHIVLNMCNNMHGLDDVPLNEEYKDCLFDRHKDETLSAVIRRGDNAIGEIVNQIISSAVWTNPGNAAIVITWDEDYSVYSCEDNTSSNKEGVQGCCSSYPGSPPDSCGGKVATIVITNRGPLNRKDPTPYNHYSLLRTCEEAFGISEYLGLAGDKRVNPMTPLFEESR